MTNSTAQAVSTSNINSVVDGFMPANAVPKYRDFVGVNKEIFNARLQNEINRSNMAYDLYKSNTAYQRSVEDMKKAGLNPYLAYSNGGFTPASSSSSAISSLREIKGDLADPLTQLFTSALKVASGILGLGKKN